MKVPPPKFKPININTVPAATLKRAVLAAKETEGAIIGSRFEQVDYYMTRLLRTLPFPVDTAETYYHCLPDNVRDQLVRDAADDNPLPLERIGKDSNYLMLLYGRGDRFFGDADNLLHLSVSELDEYHVACEASASFEFKHVFWMELPASLPVPVETRTRPFFVPMDHPHRARIRQWREQAERLQIDMDNAMQATRKLFKAMDTQQEMETVWPAVVNFLRWPREPRRALPALRKRQMQEQFEELLAPRKRELIERLLTEAAMLPEGSGDIKAWINYR